MNKIFDIYHIVAPLQPIVPRAFQYDSPWILRYILQNDKNRAGFGYYDMICI